MYMFRDATPAYCSDAACVGNENGDEKLIVDDRDEKAEVDD